MNDLGKILVVGGVVLIVVGILLMQAPKIPFLGNLPGDIHFKRDNFEVIVPLTTSLILSLLLSGIIWILGYFGKK
jgi:hypothetical protein